MTRRAGLLALAALAALTLLGWAGVSLAHGGRIESLETRIQRHRSFLAEAAGDLDRRIEVRDSIDAFTDRTLGGDREAVDHALRTRLNRLGEIIELDDLLVDTLRATRQGTPAARQLDGRGQSGLRKELRDRPDFVEVEAIVSGEGTLEQALRLVHRLEAEPWPKRIDRVHLDPDDNGERVSISVRLATLFVPGATPGAPPPALSRNDPPGFNEYAALAAMNPFRLPPPPPEPEPEPEPEPPPVKPEFPYGEWGITGIVDGPDGGEVWLTNRRTGDARRLSVGDRLHEAVLVAAKGDRAEFGIGEERFDVAVGQTLRERIPIGP